MSWFDRLPWEVAEYKGYLGMEDRCKIRSVHEIFQEFPFTDNDIEGTVVGIVTSYRLNRSTGRARVTLLDETGLINTLVDESIMSNGGQGYYVRIGAVIVAKETSVFTLDTSPPVGCLHINKDCIIAIISKQGEVVPGILYTYSDELADDDDVDDDDEGDGDEDGDAD